MTSHITRRSLLAASGAALALALAACSANDPLAQQANAGDNKNYIAGDGSVSEYGVSDRSAPVNFSGKLLDGASVNSSSFVGKVTVLNFWYAACSPCRAEAKDLESLYKKYESKDVEFYGVNIRDETPTANAFIREFGLTYPSFQDNNGGIMMAMASLKYVTPDAVPTTLVLDKKGRVSARILGAADKSTLDSLIATAVAEK